MREIEFFSDLFTPKTLNYTRLILHMNKYSNVFYKQVPCTLWNFILKDDNVLLKHTR